MAASPEVQSFWSTMVEQLLDDPEGIEQPTRLEGSALLDGVAGLQAPGVDATIATDGVDEFVDSMFGSPLPDWGRPLTGKFVNGRVWA